MRSSFWFQLGKELLQEHKHNWRHVKFSVSTVDTVFIDQNFSIIVNCGSNIIILQLNFNIIKQESGDTVAQQLALSPPSKKVVGSIPEPRIFLG